MKKNHSLKGSINLLEIFTSGFWKFSSVVNTEIAYYRPLTTLFYFLQYKVFETVPQGYHFVSVLIHLLNVFLVWKIAKSILPHPFITILVPFLFSIHPAQAHSVSSISSQGDLLATFFCLWSFLLWIEKRHRPWSLGLLFLGMLSKEFAVVMPLIFVLWDGTLLGKNFRRPATWAPLLIWIPYFFLRAYGLREAFSFPSYSSSFLESWGSFRFFVYIGRLLLPYPQPPEITLLKIKPDYFLFFHAAFFFLIPFCIYLTKNDRLRRFLFLSTMITILPVCDWLNYDLRVSDQFLYFPIVFFALSLGTYSHIKTYSALLQVSIILLIPLTLFQIGPWKNNMTLWKHSLQFEPRNPTFHLNYGGALMNAGHMTEGCTWMQKTVNLVEKKIGNNEPPTGGMIAIVSSTLFNLGVCYIPHDERLAKGYFLMAIKVNPKNVEARKQLNKLMP